MSISAMQIARFNAEQAKHKRRVDHYVAQQIAEGRFDDSLGLAVAKQLSMISREVVKQQFPDLRFRQHIAPVPDNGSIAPGHATYEWHYMETVGEAEIASSLTGTSNRVNLGVNGDPNVANLRHIRIGYEIDDGELEEAALAGVNVSMEKPGLARQAIERKKNTIAYLGDAAHGLLGLFTDPNVPEVDSAGGAMSGMTADDMLTFLKTRTDQVWIDSTRIYKADTLLLPPAQYKIAKNKRFTDGSGAYVLDEFLKTSMFIKTVDYCDQLIGASDTATDMMIAYANRPEVVGYIESVFYGESAPSRVGFSTAVEARGRFGGVAWRHPLSGLKIGNI